MQQTILNDDIRVFCIKAKSFPDGVQEAHDLLHALVPYSAERKFFGLSRPEQDHIIQYRAAAEELMEGEFSKHGLEAFDIKKGKYIYITVHNYSEHIKDVGAAFEQLISRDDIDPQGYCVEAYLNEKDVRCMVRLKDQ